MRIKNINYRKVLICCLSTVWIFHACQSGAEKNDLFKLWYKQPADEWMKATPVGNGRLGAMIYGGVDTEIIALNEVTMWSGQAEEVPVMTDGKERLAAVRKLFFEGKLEEGNRMAAQKLAVNSQSFGSHVPIGDLKIKFKHDKAAITGYNRALNLHDAVTTVSYQADGTSYRREYFCSNPDGVLMVKLSSGKKGSLDFDLNMDMIRETDSTSFVANGNDLAFSGKVCFPKFGPGGVLFTGIIHVSTTGGTVKAGEASLKVSGADEAVITLDIRTDYHNPEYLSVCRNTIEKAVSKGYESVKNDHITDYQQLFSRVDLSLGNSEADDQPTDVRWQQVRAGKDDPGLDALFFQYGRYLLIASSREDSPLPSNLQGIWNDNLACNMGWTCDYHLDINIEQNYWPANITNLHECNAPLFEYIRFLSEHGAKVAQSVYGSPGWVAHTVVNAWGYTAAGDGVGWSMFPTANAWIASHLWTHYEYTKDRAFLEKTAYPILKGVAVFYLDYMTELPGTGFLVTGPSTSPENSFSYNGKHMSLSMMPTSDRVLVYETYLSCIEASRILGTDEDFRRTMEAALQKFPPIKAGKNGAVQEWLEDYEEAQPNHRHTTHLLALYPFAQISLARTPELAKATEKTIENRLNAEGWEDVEWSRANMICFYARLKDAQKAYESVKGLCNTFTRENLLTISPEGIAGAPWDIFIIDGNGAGTAGIAEMLLQNHEGYIEFLPALPIQWNTGYFKGLCVKGGAEIDLEWKDGKVTKATLRASSDHSFKVKVPAGKSVNIRQNDKSELLTPDANHLITLDMKKEERTELQF